MTQVPQVASLSNSLFPMLPAPETGLARMAAKAGRVSRGHLVEFRAMEVRSVLNRSVSKRRLAMAYSINPYRGCEFGCKYCYARYTHDFLAPKATSAPRDGAVGTVPGPASGPGTLPAPGAADFVVKLREIWPEARGQRAQEVLPEPAETMDLRDPEAFERVIFLKENAAWLLEQELRRIDPADEIALGTATDPYQPIERTARITRSLLEVFARRSGYRLGIVTKSRLIERDLDLLREIGRRNRLVVHITITTADAALARVLEPRAPRPDLRFAAVRRLREAGVTAGVLCSPLLPGITDSEEAVDGMARRAAAVGASFFAAGPLFLKACSRPTYLSFVREHFSSLEGEYERRFGSADFAAPDYRRELEAMVGRACRRHGLRQRVEGTAKAPLLPVEVEEYAPRKSAASAPGSQQQRLFG